MVCIHAVCVNQGPLHVYARVCVCSYQHTLPRLQAPEGVLCVNLVGELPFHQNALSIALLKGYTQPATADLHSYLQAHRGDGISNVLPPGAPPPFPVRPREGVAVSGCEGSTSEGHSVIQHGTRQLMDRAWLHPSQSRGENCSPSPCCGFLPCVTAAGPPHLA